MRREPKRSVKRSKTFTGCWTCRSRGVKCGEEKPACVRCTKGSFNCEGYGVKLVWPDEYKNNLGVQRRLFTVQETSVPALSELQLDISLENLDAAVVVDQEQDGLFSVFRLPSGRFSVDRCHSPSEQGYMVSRSHPTKGSINHLEPLESIRPVDLPGPGEERELMHYWVGHLSDLLISVSLADNPCRTVWVPMALQSMAGKDTFLEHSALLHAIYALSAYNKSQCANSNFRHYYISAIRHHHLSLKYLRQATIQPGETQLEVALAAITALSLMGVFNGDFSSWRSHLKGGRGWLYSIGQGKWNQLQTSTIYQYFICAEAMGSAIPKADASTASKETPNCESVYLNDRTFDVTSMDHQTDYVLDQYFGITKPILEAIAHINHLSTSLRPPSKIELEGLELKIQLNRPDTALEMQETLDTENSIIMDHKMVFYHACYIHFKHNLLCTPSKDLQGIVRQSLVHLQNIENYEITHESCGIIWPIFVIACESDESESRHAFLRWFATKQRLGIRSVDSVLSVVREVWNRRDIARADSEASCFVSWERVMAEMGLDLFTF
ncbi:unnamed protein product [Penicillium salamii]|uniref:Zn(2)-C6 fungal-type domain-containing protein n=1 Tax=Penicillium salamii TaxID=1612424 RepID=A0A9W4NLC9_9EURO|nr:unnamed protein product [Penicillium salamii]